MAVGQSRIPSLTHRYREQAPSHILIFSVADTSGAPRSVWEPGLPAMAACQSMRCSLTYRHRRQASSHILIVASL